jgi:hypothetical protein
LIKDVTLTTEGTSNGFKTTLAYERYTWNLEGTLVDQSRRGAPKYSTSLRLSSSNYVDIQLSADMASDDETRSGGLAVKYLTTRDRQLKTMALRGEINQLRRELKLEV